MKKNKAIKMIFFLMIIIVTLLSCRPIVYAGDAIKDQEKPKVDSKDASLNPDFYKPVDIGKEKSLSAKAGTVIGVINVIGIVTSVITLMVIGIKYMIGSVEEKAEYKKTMGMYLLGAFLIFSITTIPNILYHFGSNINEIQ